MYIKKFVRILLMQYIRNVCLLEEIIQVDRECNWWVTLPGFLSYSLQTGICFGYVIINCA